MNTEDIRARLQINEIPFRDEVPEMLYQYLKLLTEWNGRMDLTAVSDDEETVDKHFIDSLTILKNGIINEDASLIDVGTGAGFPGMVLAIARPDLQVTLMDSQKKRLLFLEKVIEETKTQNVKVIHSRAEEGARKAELRERFDFAAARALAPMNVLCEYMLPFVKPDGYALCWKGPAIKDELESGRKAAHILGGRIEMPISYNVSGRDWKHMILPIHKIQHTSTVYPRKAGTPKSKPLGL